ncbi:hypothetical protein C7974DRAFT_401878 [Boeremia exigua]|uniref:uncharacterized protein n=1 Tax=Boeremia exigua TaxID=749465 RepID=UPI001E8CB691|nr:uncharacterized protein C7974DRAFT_401878 [Boeremia exigua]KAH6616498.1 hypothetical protein C7974DRAFT_401878 [Boeremia exigua]
MFARSCDLTTHIHRKHERRYECTFETCSRAFSLRTDMQRHFKTHQAPMQRQSVRCTAAGCSRAFTRRDNMLKHLRTHTYRAEP